MWEVEIGCKVERGGAVTYVFPFPRMLKTVICPVDGCQAVVHSTGRMREHFM